MVRRSCHDTSVLFLTTGRTNHITHSFSFRSCGATGCTATLLRGVLSRSMALTFELRTDAIAGPKNTSKPGFHTSSRLLESATRSPFVSRLEILCGIMVHSLQQHTILPSFVINSRISFLRSRRYWRTVDTEGMTAV